MYKRKLNIKALVQKKSHFLFGPRGTGKTTLLKQEFLNEETLYINLLRGLEFARLQSNPGELEELVLASKQKLVVIDEIQKIPALLDEVHNLIEEHGIRFILTGSSARKLKKSDVNLLAGRAWKAEFYPLVSAEVPNFNLEKVLRYGALPAVYTSQEPQLELDAYCDTYLREEIQQEQLIRKLPPFIRFLKAAALSSGSILNYSKLGNDIQVSPNTVREYFQILYDTIIAFEVTPLDSKKSRKSVETPKFYFFDTGVMHTLAERNTLDRESEIYGQSFETWFFHELKSYLSYNGIREPIHFYREYSGSIEIDFVISSVGIEVKSAKRITDEDLKGLRFALKEGIVKKAYLVCQEPRARLKHGIEILPWKQFLAKLWSGTVKF